MTLKLGRVTMFMVLFLSVLMDNGFSQSCKKLKLASDDKKSMHRARNPYPKIGYCMLTCIFSNTKHSQHGLHFTVECLKIYCKLLFLRILPSGHSHRQVSQGQTLQGIHWSWATGQCMEMATFYLKPNDTFELIILKKFFIVTIVGSYSINWNHIMPQ